MTTGGAERDLERLARRVVLMIQRIAEDEDPSTFEVSFPTEQRLIINMQTAREIGFSPKLGIPHRCGAALRGDARGNQPTLTLLEAMKTALEANPSLAASRARLAAAG